MPVTLEDLYAGLSLSPPVAPDRAPALVILAGLPGAGKTHFAHALARRGPFTLVGSDPIRVALVGKPTYSAQENSAVYRAADGLLRRVLDERRHAIYDAANLSEQRRRALRLLAKDCDAIPLTVLITAPPHTIWLRLAARQDAPDLLGRSEADWEVHKKLEPRLECVNHPHLIVNTAQDVELAIYHLLDLVAVLPGGDWKPRHK